MVEDEGLPRSEWSNRMHACPNLSMSPYTGGQIMSLYVYFNQKWLKIGEYCRRCGAMVIFPKYRKGIPRDMLKILKRW